MNIAKSKNLKNGENSWNFSKFKKTKTSVLGNGIMKHMQNFRRLAQLEIPKNRRELQNEVNIAKSKNFKNGENSRNFSKFKKQKIGSREWYYEGVCKISGS